jgi:hypothetical protein
VDCRDFLEKIKRPSLIDSLPRTKSIAARTVYT